MSRLSELIAELCPNGVEHKRLSDVAEMQRGTSTTRKDTREGNVPVISGGREPAYYCDLPNRTGETITVAGSGAGAGYVQYWNIPIFVSDAFSVKGCINVDTKYLYYCLSSCQDYIYSTKKGGGVPHVHISDIENMKIPIPPLEVQQEIVKILDKFTQLQAELQAELDLRLKQYEHYRDDLLSFDGLSASVGGVVPKVRLGDIVDYEQPTKYLVETAEYDDSYATPVLTAGKTFILGYTDEVNDVYAASAEDPVIIFDDFTTDSKWVDFPFKAKSSAMKMLKLSDNGQKTTLLRWVYLCMQRLNYAPMDHARHWISKYSNLEIPLPSLDVQKRLVNVLDNFESICADLNIGLPAEINLRQRQYEYYRDALLTYAETGHIISQTDRQTGRHDNA